jgi:hypothetical protein
MSGAERRLAGATLLCYGDLGGRKRTNGEDNWYSKGLISTAKAIPECILRIYGLNVENTAKCKKYGKMRKIGQNVENMAKCGKYY